MIYVIMLNDSPKYAVIGSEEKADQVLSKMRDTHYDLNKWNFKYRVDYDTRCFWHISEVMGELA